MSRITLLVIPEHSSQTRQWVISKRFIKTVASLLLCFPVLLGYFCYETFSLRSKQEDHENLAQENRLLKREAQILQTNLDDVQKTLSKIDDYTQKIAEIVNGQASSVSQQTGIGPLSRDEYVSFRSSRTKPSSHRGNDRPISPKNGTQIPFGINLEALHLKPVFTQILNLQNDSSLQAFDLQKLLGILTEKKSLIHSVPTLSPVRGGWITSDFGYRISPFTKERTRHNGLDIAAPLGTPVYAPADGVVIFSGWKEDFGNCIMIAHPGSRIVTRYGHNAQNMVQLGQAVQRGDLIASVGMSGQATGTHLHYEVHIDGEVVSPRKFILNDGEGELLLAANPTVQER